MAVDESAIIRRFARAKRPDNATRRVDYKGLRARLNLRVAESVSSDLRLIKLMTGVSKNDFCNRVLADAIENTLKELKAQHDDATWQTFQRCANRE